jgi:hypothetical protein
MKGIAAFWPEAKYGKMRIEGRDPVNAWTPHYAKLVRSTIEKSWSRQETPIFQAISRFANVTVSIAAIPLRSPSQNRSQLCGRACGEAKSIFRSIRDRGHQCFTGFESRF